MVTTFKPFAFLILLSVTVNFCGSAVKREKPGDTLKTTETKSLNKRYCKSFFLLCFPRENRSRLGDKYSLGNYDEDTISVVPCQRDAPTASQDSAIISTIPGVQYHFWMDNAKIFLNAATRLQIIEDREGKRSLDLKGECLIESKKGSCIVNVDSMKIRINDGSKINIMAYHNEPNTTLTLFSGSADVSAAGHRFMMNKQKNKLELSKASGALSQTVTHSEAAALWTEGILYGQHLPCSYIFRCMERLYAKCFVWQGMDSSCNRTFAITYRDMSLKEALEEVETQLNLYSTISNDTVFLREKSTVQ